MTCGTHMKSVEHICHISSYIILYNIYILYNNTNLLSRLFCLTHRHRTCARPWLLFTGGRDKRLPKMTGRRSPSREGTVSERGFCVCRFETNEVEESIQVM